MPFVLVPMFWNGFSKRFRQNAPPTERAHGDGMMVDNESAEAFEENDASPLNCRFAVVPPAVNQPPTLAFGNIKNKLPYEMLETRRFVARHHLEKFVFNSHFPVNTLQLMRGAVAAEADGILAPYVEAVFVAMWEQSRKMDDAEVFRATLLEAGLDADRLLARTQDADVKEKLIANTQRAFERGAFGIPTFFVGDEIYFGKDRLRDVEERILEL